MIQFNGKKFELHMRRGKYKVGKKRFENGKEEFKYFILQYLLPIIGVSHNNNLQDADSASFSNDSSLIRQEKDRIVFSINRQDLFFIEQKMQLTDDVLNLARNIIPAFLSVAQYRMSGSYKSPQMNYPSDEIHEENLKLAVQKGICDWCTGTHNSSFYRLVHILEQWSVQTYEGKKVTFGFVVDPHAKQQFQDDKYGTWFDFIKDDYAATLTDCIHSVILLDKNCCFSQYLSVTEGNKIDEYCLQSILPYRFARVIDKYVTGSRVGVFLLNNGDIIISKNKAIRLIKRNLKWINLSYDAFRNAVLSRIPPDINLLPSLIEEIYASTLDVSLAHTGGIISVVVDSEKLCDNSVGDEKQSSILSSCDYIKRRNSFEEIEQELKAANQGTNKLRVQEINKRLLKRKAIISLIGDKRFNQIDRKLRAELISMDGACIIDLRGNICAFGAIIQNESGSAGGGRSAAARRLSRFGLAVKISTDGYIELFIDGEAVYSIK